MNIEEGVCSANNQSAGSVRNAASSEETENLLLVNNPNEPPNELNVPTTQSDNRISDRNNISIEREIEDGSGGSGKAHPVGFRNIKDLFKAVKREEAEAKAARIQDGESDS